MAPADPAASSEGDKVLTFVAAVVAAASAATWAAHQLTALLWSSEWLSVTLWEGPLMLWQLIIEPDDPFGAAPIHTAPPAVFYVTLALILLAAGFAVIAGRRMVEHFDRPERPDSAEWAQPRDLKPILVRRPKPGRLTLGTVSRRLVATEEQHSVAVIAPTGTGKTTGFAIPALLEWDGPVIATTIKGDVVEHTIERRRSRGQVWVYDPLRSTGQAPAGWSPLTQATDWQGALRMAAWLVSTARAGDRGGPPDSEFWYAVTQKLLAPLLHAAAVSDHTLSDVVRWVDLQDTDQPVRLLQRAGAEMAVQAFTATINREERARSGAYTTSETVLAAYADPDVVANTAIRPAYAPEELLDGGNHTLYICGSLDDQKLLRPLFTAVIEQTIRAVYRRANDPSTRLTKPLLLVIDEAANIAPLPNLAQIASTARGVGIQLVTVWQDFAQLQDRYGTLAQTVINNHRAKIVLSGISDTLTLDYISRLAGEQAVAEVAESSDPDGQTRSTTESTRYRPLAPPAQLRQAKIGTGVLIYGNLAPAKLRLRKPVSHRARRVARRILSAAKRASSFGATETTE